MEENKELEFEIKLSNLFDVFKQCWWIMLLVGAITCVAVFLGLTLTHEDEFTAKTTIYVLKQNDESSSTVSTSDISIANYLINDFMQLVYSNDNVLEPVLKRNNPTGLLTTKDLAKMIKVTQTNDTRLLTLSVTTEDKNTSRDLANDVAAFACDYFNLRQNANIANVVDKAVAPKDPSNPVSMLKVLLIAFVCAFVVYAIYLVVFIMDDKINNEEDVQKVLAMNVLGVIPNREEVSKSKSKRYAAYASYNTDIAK